MRLILSLLSVIVLMQSTFAQGGLVITEIMANPSSTRDDVLVNCDEWFEIYNTGPSSVDLSTIKFDNDSDASDGEFLSGSVAAGAYAIVGNRNQPTWEAEFGTLPVGTTYVHVHGAGIDWQPLANGGGTLTLYDTATTSNFFGLNYGTTTDGVALQYVGSNPALVSPYVFSPTNWQNATTSPGGNSGDLHSAGVSNINANATPEPAAVLLMVISGLALLWSVRSKVGQSV